MTPVVTEAAAAARRVAQLQRAGPQESGEGKDLHMTPIKLDNDSLQTPKVTPLKSPGKDSKVRKSK